jgi:hypothetical protein
MLTLLSGSFASKTVMGSIGNCQNKVMEDANYNGVILTFELFRLFVVRCYLIAKIGNDASKDIV